MAAGQRRGTAASPLALALGLLAVAQVFGDQNQGAVFLREFTLIRRESLHDDFLSDLLNNHKTEDPVYHPHVYILQPGEAPVLFPNYKIEEFLMEKNPRDLMKKLQQTGAAFGSRIVKKTFVLAQIIFNMFRQKQIC